MSLTDDLLIILTDYSGGYKLMRKRLTGMEVSRPEKIDYRKLKEQTLRITLSRLKKRGLAENRSGIWAITKKGRKFLKNKLISKIPHFGHLKTENKKKETVVIFDIPEIRKKQRNWLRMELMVLGFIPLQKSVWLGPAPLPKEFIQYLSDTNLLPYLKFFKATEEDIVSSN
jgi:DNA-binding transcriptional regulator PaaX